MGFKTKMMVLVVAGLMMPLAAKSADAQSTCDSKAYAEETARRCCDLGFRLEEEGFECCQENVAKENAPGTPENPTSCEPPKGPCDDIHDVSLKACCEEHGGLSMDAVMDCIPDQPDPSEDCNIIINGDVNGQLTVCCQIVNQENGSIDGGVVQQCGNAFTPGEKEEPTDPCEKSPDLPECKTETASEPTPDFSTGSCVVTAARSEDFVKGKLASISSGGTGVGLVIRAIDLIKGPAAYVELKQVAGPLVVLEGTSAVDAGEEKVKILDTKIIGAKSAVSQPSWMTYMTLPKSLVGRFIPDAKFTLSVYDVKANLLAETSCEQKALIQSQGGSGGCSLIRD